MHDAPHEFHVTDDASANWVVRRIVEARAYLARIKDWAERETRRVQREEEFFFRRFGEELEAWARSQLRGRRKCVALPAGRIGFRRAAAKLTVTNPEAVLRWARKHCPEAVIVIERLSKSALNKRFKQDGEVPDAGAHVEPEREAFYVR
ncbi:MAG: host-nuclease inhibitor Gam family protein [Phycisphaerae bacterium]|nr:host-nuclease inhibitor Gam family protein [Tepidisphaeraceae bacterium]